LSSTGHVEHGALSDARTSKDAEDMACPFMGGKKCLSFHCMGWRWIAYGYEVTKTPANLMPSGDGWILLGKVGGMTTWKRPRDNATRKGYCGAIPGTANVVTGDL
jgi:hypothetical protein